MGLLDFLRGADINEGVKEYRSSEDGILLDVRTKEEYKDGHIPGSRNIPLDEIDRAQTQLPNKKAPVFVYCLKGSRSNSAVRKLRKMGFENVKSIGGIENYRGRREKR